ncbi:MAG: DUF4261 domain-containing protein [Mycobacterium leprae]
MKGIFTQGIMVLLEQAPAASELERCLAGFPLYGQRPGSGIGTAGGPTYAVLLPQSERGTVLVDLVDQPWPDDMGHRNGNMGLMTAWRTGHFGPLTHPGSLGRALGHSRGWPEAGTAVGRHRAFLRLRTTYEASTDLSRSGLPGEGVALVPTGMKAVSELIFLTRLALALLSLPGALCYFNPAGEVLATGDQLNQALDRQAATGALPLEIWANRRLHRWRRDWFCLDLVGLQQLDTADHEAFFLEGRYAAVDVASFLLDMARYLLAEGPVIRQGDTADGPRGEQWQAHIADEATMAPERPVLRWAPLTRGKLPF